MSMTLLICNANIKNWSKSFGLLEAIMQTKQQSSPLVEIITKLSEGVRAFWRQSEAINALANCDALEVARVAQDLGISAADLRILASKDKTAADLLHRTFE